MFRKIKKYLIRYAALIFAVTFLTGCKNDTCVDFYEIVENAEYHEAETQESEVLEDLIDVNTADIYEHFLDGGLAAEWEGQQVQASELFWDNDIEYCFLDIDGDGEEELQIRDSVKYYVAKVRDETLQIIFEGRGEWEPVVTDHMCGLLYDWHKYGQERIEFIKINADGSQESEGEYHWFDTNKNGDMDEEDSFYGREGSDMEQYVQYRQEKIAGCAESMLPWTKRRLKHFETWKEAYIDFINKMHITESVSDNWDYALIYVDDDDVPELFIYMGFMASGETIVSFYDGTIGTMNRDRSGMRYIEYGGLLYNGNGNAGFYPCNIYMLEKGVFSEIGTGWYSDHSDEQGNVYYEYFWEDSAVTEDEFEAHIDELIDRSKCIEPSMIYTESEILEILTS